MQNSVLRSRMTLVYWSQNSSVVLCTQNSDFSIRIIRLYGSQPSFVAFAGKSDFRTGITSLYGSHSSPMVFCIQNSDFSTRIASLYGSQPSPGVLCIHNNDIMTRINSLYRSKTSPVVLQNSDLIVSIGPRPHPSFCA